MSCPLPQPNWWARYLAGEFTTPQELVAAAYAEIGNSLHPSSDRFPDLPEDTGLWNAPERLKAPGWFLNNSYLRQLERADWSHADPRLMVWSALFLNMARNRQIPLYVHSCLRDEAEQNELVRKGNSKARYPTSAHNIGEAVDIVHGTYHWEMTEAEWKTLHALGRLALERLNATLKKDNKLSLEWGGSWKFYDPAHWEVTDYRNRTRKLPKAEPTRMTPHAIIAKRGTLLAGL